MKTKWHYFCTASPELLDALKQHAVPVEISPAYQDKLLSIPARLTFDLFEDDSFFADIRAQLPEDTVSTPDLCFSDAELQAAQWLTVRGTNLRLEIANPSDAFYCTEPIDETRARHRYRTGQPFSLRMPVKWDRQHYFCCAYDLGDDYLFCRDMAKDVLEEFHCEIQYEPVYAAKTGQPIPDLSFLNLTQVLPQETIRWERGTEELVCPQCGKTQIDYSGDFQLHASEATLNSMGNFFRTEAIFGGGSFLSPIHIVTQALYRALTERGMTRGLRFTPVVLF